MPAKKQVSWNAKVSKKFHHQQQKMLGGETEEDYLKRISEDGGCDDDNNNNNHAADASSSSSDEDHEEQMKSRNNNNRSHFSNMNVGNSQLRFQQNNQGNNNNEDDEDDEEDQEPRGPTELIIDEDNEEKKRSVQAKDIENAIFDDLFLLQEREEDDAAAVADGNKRMDSTTLLSTHPTNTTNATTTADADAGPMIFKCYNCGAENPKYRCPRCSLRSCSLNCVKSHKTKTNCSGVADAGRFVALTKFNSDQLRRDVRFITDCCRVVSNSQRCGNQLLDGSLHHHQSLMKDPDSAVSNVNNESSQNNSNSNSSSAPTWRYNYRALPPPLHSLRENAKSRGILCQITSEGMLRRQQNTSRFDRFTSSITWHAEFQFFLPQQISQLDHNNNIKPFITMQTRWANERNLLRDVVMTCWANDPVQLPKYSLGRNIFAAKKVFSLNAENLDRLANNNNNNRFSQGRSFSRGGGGGGYGRRSGPSSYSRRSYSRATSSFSKYIAPGEEEEEEGRQTNMGNESDAASTTFDGENDDVKSEKDGGEKDQQELDEESKIDNGEELVPQPLQMMTAPDRPRGEVIKPVFASTFEKFKVENAHAKGKISAVLDIINVDSEFSIRNKRYGVHHHHHHQQEESDMKNVNEEVDGSVQEQKKEFTNNTNNDDDDEIFIPQTEVEAVDDDAVVEKSARKPPPQLLTANENNNNDNNDALQDDKSSNNGSAVSSTSHFKNNGRGGGEEPECSHDQQQPQDEFITIKKSIVTAKQPFAVFAQAERVYGGDSKNEKRYLRLDVEDTVCNALRKIFFINEFPVFFVVPFVLKKKTQNDDDDEGVADAASETPYYDLPEWAKQKFVEATNDELQEMRNGFRRKPAEARNHRHENNRENDQDEDNGDDEGNNGKKEAGEDERPSVSSGGQHEEGASSKTEKSNEQEPQKEDEAEEEKRGPAKDLSNVPCKNFLKGRCHAALRGEHCPFLHCAQNEVPLCRSMLNAGSCNRGERCSYSHDSVAIRAHWNEGGMQGSHYENNNNNNNNNFNRGRGGRGFGRGGGDYYHSNNNNNFSRGRGGQFGNYNNNNNNFGGQRRDRDNY